MKQEITSLLAKVQEMRSAQKAFFKFKGDPEKKKGILIRSKQLEIDVDQETERLQAQLANDPSLALDERTRVIGELVSLVSRIDDSANKRFISALIDDLSKASHRDIRERVARKEAVV